MIARERDCVTLLCLCNSENDSFEEFYLVPDVNRTDKWFRIRKRDKWFDRGKRISDLSTLKCIARVMYQQKNVPPVN